MTDNRIARPEDDYSEDWNLYWRQNPAEMRSVGAEAAAEEAADAGTEAGEADTTDTSGETAETGEDTASNDAGTEDTAGAETPQVSFRDLITDDNLRKTVEKFDSVDSLVKSYREAEKRISQGFKPPDENASEKEIKRFREAMGIPDSPENYTIPKPEHIDEETFNSEQVQGRLKSFVEKMHQAGAPDSVVQEAISTYWEMDAQARQELEDQAKQFADQSMETLKKKWGSDEEFEKNRVYASNAGKRMFGEQFEDAKQLQLADGNYLLDHPVMIEAFARIGREMGEDTVGAALTDTERQSREDRFNELTNEIYAAERKNDRQAMKKLTEERDRIATELWGTGEAV